MLLLLRITACLLVLVIFLQPSRREVIPPPTLDKVLLVALDTSMSMNQRDEAELTRLETAHRVLRDARLDPDAVEPVFARARYFQFDRGAGFLQAGASLPDKPSGTSTLFHQSVSDIFGFLQRGEGARALLLLTDGHDFEMVNPTRTGFFARGLRVPVYAVALGSEGSVRDVSTQIISYLPYSYANQKSRIQALLRIVGCEFERIEVQLLRQGNMVQRKSIDTDVHQQVPVHFDVMEPEIGQFEYEIQTRPVDNEVDEDNNSALTYLNIINQKIEVLLLEGKPYWDTTFLHRSLRKNDKMRVDAIIKYTDSKVRYVRSEESAIALTLPDSIADFQKYDIVILGRGIDELLNREQLEHLDAFVRDQGGTLIFSRGPASARPLAAEPVEWSETSAPGGQVLVAKGGKRLAPFRMLEAEKKLPPVIAVHIPEETKMLSATLAGVRQRGNKATVHTVVHRRYGRGQVLSIGATGLWRWAFNQQMAEENSVFDRFWDQLALWLMAGRDFIPDAEFVLRSNTVNVPLGEPIYLRLVTRNAQTSKASIPVSIYQGDEEIERLSLSNREGESKATAAFFPDSSGRFRAVAQFPDNTVGELRFMAYEENLEETEVAADRMYLKRLCESSGGKLLDESELEAWAADLASVKVDAKPKIRMVPLWDRPLFYYSIGILFAAEWYLRRRWGLC